MIATNNSIVVSVNITQKDEAMIGGNLLKTAKGYNENFRERNPVIAHVEKGCEDIPAGSWIVCNYSYFDLDSPLHLYDNLYSIPIDEEIFAIINEDGSLTPVMGNVLVQRITKETKIDLPEELKNPYTNRGILLTDTKIIKKGKYIFWLQMADYEIVYSWNNVEKREIKVHINEIVGYLK